MSSIKKMVKLIDNLMQCTFELYHRYDDLTSYDDYCVLVKDLLKSKQLDDINSKKNKK